MTIENEERELIDAALHVREHSYSPYSKFRVGAAVRLRDGRVFVGTNVENVSFGLTVCAERNAIAAAVAGGAQPGDVVAVAVVADAAGLASPCGACRQVLAEFTAENCDIVMHNPSAAQSVRMKMSELLPHAFDRVALAWR